MPREFLDVTKGGAPGSELHQIVPREQVGAGTGDRFDFQYHQAAADALQLLDDTSVVCVYCEWHDDYVVEAAGLVSYRFHQVKTRSGSQGPWTVNEFFGIKRPRAKVPKDGPRQPKATTDSIFGRLWDHVAKFGARCEVFVFVSDAAVAPDFGALLGSARSAAASVDLLGGAAKTFAALHGALVTAFPSLTADDFFSFLKRLFIREAIGRLGDARSSRTLIGGRIYEISEVNLTQSEAQKIGADLVSAVRDRSHRVLSTLPTSTSELRAAKGLVLDDVLRILSLSTGGYRELKAGGRETVVTLSRLHRLCKRSGMADSLIPDICRIKTMWDGWWIGQRHAVNMLDFLALKKECADALIVHANGRMTFNDLRSEANALAAKYASVLTATERLDGTLVFGLMMALSVEAEP